MISDLQLIDLLSGFCNAEICVVDQEGSTLYTLIVQDDKLVRVNAVKGKQRRESTIWTRITPLPVDCTQTNWNGSH